MESVTVLDSLFAVQKMARAYAARLGCIAMVFGLLRQPFNSGSTSQALLNAIGLLIAFSVLGYIIGALTEILIRQSLEANFRRAVEKYQKRTDSAPAKQN